MIKRISFLAGFIFFIGTSCLAQIYPTQYRPPNQDWQYLQTPHFKLVYGSGNDSSALQMGRILEEQYSSIQNLVGGELNNFPVVLNSYNDRSNGFVSPIHFRSEIELPPIKGKELNPQTGNWLENVGPHELVHAIQLSNLGNYNIPQFMSLFSPDLARSFHGAIPLGVLEGVAVYHETKNVASNGGRGNLPFFTNQFDATFNSGQRWSMGQHVQTSTDTRPFNRHYIGGYEFTAWLQDKYGGNTTHDALDFYMDFPFLGYGVALRHATGYWPGQLYNRYEEDQEMRMNEKKQISAQTTALDLPYKGRDVRRPKWRSDSTIVFYGSFYNARPGFYSYNIPSSDIERLATTNTVSDYRYDLSADRSSMIFSYYETDPIYDNTAKAELVQFNFETHQKKQISKGGRLYAPVYFGDDILALQTRPASSSLVSVQEDEDQALKIEKIVSAGDHEITAISTSSDNRKLAVVVNKRGMQALWISERGELEQRLQESPDIVFRQGSVFDPQFHPGGNKIMFSSDFSGTMQLYEYDQNQQVVRQLTDDPYGAFEGSYSPDGERIAYIRQVKNERLLAVLQSKNGINSVVSANLWQSSESKMAFMERPVVAETTIVQSADWETGNYSAGAGWLKPRMVLPVFEEISNRDVYQAGVSLHSNTLLADQRYAAELSYAEQRGWYDITYQNKMFYPGFKARLFNEPSYISIQNENIQPVALLRQRRGLALSVPLLYRFNQNIYNTSLFFEPEFRRSQVRFHSLLQADASSDFANTSIANLYGQFNYRLQQNIRDVQPNSGVTLFSEWEHYISAGETILPAGNQNIQLKFQQPSALHGGIFAYFSPLRRWNQSLRLGVTGITQSGIVFDNQSIVSDAFSEPVLAGSNNLVSFSSRYTIPLMHVDNGGFLLPLYLSNIYLVTFSDTVTDPTLSDWREGSRTVFGIGLRTRFRLSNLAFDIGVGFGYEPTRGETEFFIGDF